MQPAAIPASENDRLDALRSYNILDTMAEQDFDDLTAIAASICEVPIALVSLVDEDRQWFKSKVGLDAEETPRDLAFCAHAILEPEKVFVVPDAQVDERFHDNPLVTGGPEVRFYGGAPLVDPDGNALGTLCVIDHEAKELSAHQIQSLEALSRQVVGQMELRKKVWQLENQKQELEEKNKALDESKNDIVLVSRRKSEFLANMSHELRTPLNSLLILAKMLSENKIGNLNEKQVRHAQIIHRSGGDLLDLINDILDLSKVEAGHLEFCFEETGLDGMLKSLQRLFQHVAEEKQLGLKLHRDEQVPDTIITDAKRLQQIIKNLLSNAFKFTREGQVEVHIRLPREAERQRVGHSDPAVVISVSDTGIGIPEDKQQAIFDAFQQADGLTSRNYGGTGLGLSIAREFSQRLGGTVFVESVPGEGSSFSVIITMDAPDTDASATTPPSDVDAQETDTSLSIENRDAPLVLVIEDDPVFGEILGEFASERGFRFLHVDNGADGLEAARREQPSAILLDVEMPGMSGYEVKEKLGADPSTRDIPVHFISALEPLPEIEHLGYAGYLTKPVSAEELQQLFQTFEPTSFTPQHVLVVEDDPVQQEALLAELQPLGVVCDTCTTATQARILILEQAYDAIILDLELANGETGFQLLDELEQIPGLVIPTVIVYTAIDLGMRELERLHTFTDRVVQKQGIKNPELLHTLDTFLGNIPEKAVPEKAVPEKAVPEKVVSPAQESTPEDRVPPPEKPVPPPPQAVATGDAAAQLHVLLVDDDVRNVFSLSAALEDEGMEIDVAENGRHALESLDAHPEYDIVLMDIMMPEMDGYEATRKIRLQERFADLPIIALTAKAMTTDRDKCIDAGASDYLTKPVDIDLLLERMRALTAGSQA